MNYSTIPEMFLKVCNKYGSKNAYIFKIEGKTKKVTYNFLLDSVESFAVGLLNLGIRRGDRVGIASENRLEWIIADYALAGIGAVSVPVFPTLTSKQEAYIFNNCQASAVIVSNKFQLNKIQEVRHEIPSLRQIIVMNNDVKDEDLSVKSINEVIKRGNELKKSKDRKKIYTAECEQCSPDNLHTIIYTSGTTGNPKGVMLTNKNIVSNITGIKRIIHIDSKDVFLTFLPWCHSYERTTGYYVAFEAGSTIAIAESLETVAANMTEFKPTLMTTVPKLLEVIKKKVYLKVSQDSAGKQKIFYWAVEIGKEYLRRKMNGLSISFGLKSKYKMADKMVFSKIRAKTGGKLRMFISGGAALPPDVCEFFLLMNIIVLEGYGLTEASPVVSANSPDSIEIGTIGKPLFNVQLKIADDGEILVKGENVMKGYWEDPLATKEAIDHDGWLYTGDVGTFTDKGNIKITDRKKYIFVNSGGKNIAPQPIENVVSQSIFIEHVMLLGDNREYVTALITPDFEQLKILAESLQVSWENETELISNEHIIKVIKQDIDRLQKDFAKFERVRKFQLLSQPFSVENGELTPKMSIKRHIVERKYTDLIEQMYGLSQ